jgi:(2R)-3-sulfolactate dehydrogenase (NADP+)
MNMTAAEIHDLIAAALRRSNTCAENAKSVAAALVAAELAGQGGHGLRRVLAYCGQARSGKVDGHAKPTSRETRPGALAVDAANGFAYPALDLTIDWLPDAARRQGIAIAGVRNSHHCGVAGVPVERLAELGVIGILMANSPAAIAPWGGHRALFGTDPISFAAPIENGDPIVVDVSFSKVARGKIMAASQKGEDIPEGWALDSDGRPTTDANAALAGTMVPLGDAKGTALALMVELLCAGLTGANYGYEATSFFDAEGAPPGVGQIIIAIDTSVFGANGITRFSHLAREIESVSGARIPGRRRQDLRQRLLKEGITVDPDLVSQIRMHTA